jgi:peptidoglycan/LPS O-acetylase OafA/YrhL
MTENEWMANKKLVYLDSIRGLASFAVVLSHLALMYFPFLHNFSNAPITDDHAVQRWIHNSPFGFFYSGTAAVYIFFVMSGIVLSLSSARNHYPLAKNILSRYARLAIPAIASCLLAYIVFTIVREFNLQQASNFINNETKIREPGLVNAIYFGAVKAIVNLRGAIQYNPVLWTMAIEFYGSLLIFIAYKTRKPLLTMSLLTLLFLAINLHVFLGMLSFLVGMAIKERMPLTENNKISSLMIIVGLYFAGAHISSGSYALFTSVLGNNVYEALNFLAGIMIVWGVMLNGYVQSWLSSKALVKLGELSFPLYLTHWSVILLFANLFDRFNFHHPLAETLMIALLSVLFSVFFVRIDQISIRISGLIKRYSRAAPGRSIR